MRYMLFTLLMFISLISCAKNNITYDQLYVRVEQVMLDGTTKPIRGSAELLVN